MDRHNLIGIGLLLLALIWFVGFVIPPNHKWKPESFSYEILIKVGDSSFFVAKADSSDSWAIGLSGQKTIEEKQGLLFVFDHPDKWSIWMKDMEFPIDVMWFDEENRVIYIKNNFLPGSFPETVYPPSPASFVLELKAGTAERRQIRVGDLLSF